MRLVDRPSRAWLEREKLSQLLRSCSNLEQGKQIHARARRIDLEKTPLLASLLISMYTRCGDLDSARQLFQSTPQPDIHARNSLITTYARIREIADAKKLFDEAPGRNSASWAVMVTAFVGSGDLETALDAFNRAPGRTLAMSTSMIAASGQIDCAREVFDEMLERDLIAWNAMVSAYALAGQVDQARMVLERMPAHSVASCSPLIHAYASNGDVASARGLYGRVAGGESPVLCTAVARLLCSWEFFQELGGRNVISWTALLDSSAQAGDLDCALRVFEAMPQRDAIAWGSMITALARAGDPDRAKTVFESMPERDLAAWTTMIKAFGDHADNGRRAEEVYQRMPSHDAVAAAAMITAFAQCGHLRESRALFASIPEWNLDRGSWNTMIAACARYERGREVVELLRSMRCEGEDPDEVSFVAALLAHSHTGMLEAAGALFRSMRSDHWLDPSQEHYWAMIDVLARVGRIADAEELVNTMPFLPDDVAWATLQRIDCGSSDVAADRALGLNPRNGAAYVLLASNLRRTKENIPES
ncbi:pentatricopeptide repeat-containing protein At4g02750 [Selaginella moellendorffii]|uniref:pentatricopeptide repeat-containing protein At4g02750 n=1 Tax=Selaginella moellendorffii TaxID=88036 RepID=UPI000D1C6F98|nr:pentatricopeptide repeat-containing protein At4g02750 [Selaginella moellendorffii]|eukprot:XP_024524796.1 pentatricopeptide repeat-containing protein At4g02750 [Selaginella moellendorffii]